MIGQDSIFSWLATEPGKAAVAGALGGVVRWVTLRASWREGLATLIVGTICAIYLGPVAVPLIESTIGKLVPGADTTGLSAFFVGVGGIGISGMVLDIIDRRRKDLKGGDSNEK